MSHAIARRRWIAKKLARRGCAAGTWASGSLVARRIARDRPEIRAITYHRFGRPRRDPFCVDTEVFEAQVRYLAESGLAVSLSDLEQFVAGNKLLPDGAVLITTDDGYRSVYTTAFPILRHYGVPSVSYITTSLIEDGVERPDDVEPYLTWDQIAEMAEGGMAIGSHAFTHDSLGRMSPEQAHEQGQRSLETLRARLGTAASPSFAYPYGVGDHHSDDTARVLQQCGYTTVFLSVHGSIEVGDDPLRLKRVKIEGGEGMWMFKQSCRGAMDPWALIDSL